MRLFSSSSHSGVSPQYQCFFCLHVRTGTILLGVWQLIIHVAAIVFLSVYILNPSEIFANGTDANESLYFHENTNDYGIVDGWNLRPRHKLTSENQCFALLLTIVSMLLAGLLIYGALKRRAQWLMPYFCMQVFDFSLSCLTVVGYFSSRMSIQQWLERQPDSEFKHQLLQVDPNQLAFMAVVLILIVLAAKAYFIGVVWDCYKYLQSCSVNRRLAGTSGGGRADQDEETSLFDDIAADEVVEFDASQLMLTPPKYEDAVKEPRLTVNLPPPPPYEASTP